jgi:hypothetical protein
MLSVDLAKEGKRGGNLFQSLTSFEERFPYASTRYLEHGDHAHSRSLTPGRSRYTVPSGLPVAAQQRLCQPERKEAWVG